MLLFKVNVFSIFVIKKTNLGIYLSLRKEDVIKLRGRRVLVHLYF